MSLVSLIYNRNLIYNIPFAFFISFFHDTDIFEESMMADLCIYGLEQMNEYIDFFWKPGLSL